MPVSVYGVAGYVRPAEVPAELKTLEERLLKWRRFADSGFFSDWP